MEAWLSVSMGRKVASTSARVYRKLVRELWHTRRSARTAARQGLAHAPRNRGGQSLGRSLLGAGSKATDVTDDFPEFVAVLDRELEAIEVYLGACLNEMLGDTD
jgi:hypothetical protein